MREHRTRLAARGTRPSRGRGVRSRPVRLERAKPQRTALRIRVDSLNAAGRCVALATGLLFGLAGDAYAASFDYLYIEANEGDSSGGHTAIRFGERAYHFQNRDGRLVLDRETTSGLFHRYTLLSNRTIELQRVELAEADRARALAQFELRHRAQARQLDVLAALGEDRALLETWSAGAPGPAIAGLGYFDGAGAPSPTVARLLEKLRARFGESFVEERRESLREAVARAASADPTAWQVTVPEGIYDEPPFQLPFARRYQAAVTSLAALRVLEQRAGLRPDAIIRPQGPSWWLEPAERAQLDAFARELEGQLLRLAGSSRSNWGKPFLVALARRLALDDARRTGRFVFLNSVPDHARHLDRDITERRPGVVGQIILAGHEEAEAARRAWSNSRDAAERDWSRLEGAANRVHELESALRERRELRVARGLWVPARTAPAPQAPPARDDLQRATDAVSAREDHYRDALDRMYRYGLITRNCVSEIFHTLNDSEASLGGHIDGHSNFAFVPFLSAEAVDREYRVTAQRTLPSWRELQITEMKRHENPLVVGLRESNTLTARSYRKGQEDSWFLFFTDDAFLLRPVFGAFNLIAAVGESLWGVAALPFDRGETLASGIQGSLASLPELVFWNIRKGSNDWAPARQERESEN